MVLFQKISRLSKPIVQNSLQVLCLRIRNKISIAAEEKAQAGRQHISIRLWSLLEPLLSWECQASSSKASSLETSGNTLIEVSMDLLTCDSLLVHYNAVSPKLRLH